MARKKSSEIEKDIKKRWLEEHLAEVERIAGEWLGQLSPGLPFFPPHDEEAWRQPYEPPLERDPEKNHLLRRHLRSRTLWGHHTTWLGLLRAFNEHRKELLEVAKAFVESQDQFQLRKVDFAYAALWEGWEQELRRLGKRRGIPPEYRLNDAGPGVKFGAFLIEASATQEEQVEPVRKLHEELIEHLAGLDRFQKAIRVWSDIEDVGKKMADIGRRTVKSHDTLHPCQYCRHLWK